MDNNQILTILNNYKLDLDFVNVIPIRHTDDVDLFKINNSKILEHAHWMILEMFSMLKENNVNEQKIHRWLGFVQGALWSVGFYSIDKMKKDNTTK